MYLVTSWRESLAMLKPSNIKLLLLVSIKASMHVYVLLLKYWWWLLGLIALADVLLVGQLLVEPAAIVQHVSIWWIYSYFFLKAMLWFIIFLSARSSIKNKNMNYFLTYLKGFFLVSLFGSLLMGIAAIWIMKPLNLQPVTGSLLGIGYLITYLVVIWNFFLFDRGAPRYGIKAFINALYMMILNLPFVLASFICFNAIMQMINLLNAYLISSLPWSVQLVLYDALFIMIAIVIINIVSTFYIKRVHDQWNMY